MVRLVSVLGIAFLAAVALSNCPAKVPERLPEDANVDVGQGPADRVVASCHRSVFYDIPFSPN